MVLVVQSIVLFSIHLFHQINLLDAFTVPCNASRLTMKRAAKCPSTLSSYKEAVMKKNCFSWAAETQRCRSFEYHCVLSDDFQYAIEVCAPSILIIGRVCTMFNTDLETIMRIDNKICEACPYSYNSTYAFQYSECYANITDSVTTTIMPRTISDEGDHSGALAALGSIVGILSIVIIILILLLIHFQYWKIRQDTPKENGDSNQPMLPAANHEVSTETDTPKENGDSNQPMLAAANHEFSTETNTPKENGGSNKPMLAAANHEFSTETSNMENKLYKDGGSSIRFCKLISHLGSKFPHWKLKDLKNLMFDSRKIKNLKSLETANTARECFMILQDENLFSQNDVIFMQFLLRETGCLDLNKICIKYAMDEKALCFFEKQPGSRQSNVQFHVEGKISDYQKDYIDRIVETVAAIIDCSTDEIFVNGIKPSASFIIVLSMKRNHASELINMNRQNRHKLMLLKVDYLIVDDQPIYMNVAKDSMENGNQYVYFHVQREFDETQVKEIQNKVSSLVECNAAVKPCNKTSRTGFFIVFSMKVLCFWKLLMMRREDKKELNSLGIDYFLIKSLTVHIHMAKGTLDFELDDMHEPMLNAAYQLRPTFSTVDFELDGLFGKMSDMRCLLCQRSECVENEHKLVTFHVQRSDRLTHNFKRTVSTVVESDIFFCSVTKTESEGCLLSFHMHAKCLWRLLAMHEKDMKKLDRVGIDYFIVEFIPVHLDHDADFEILHFHAKNECTKIFLENNQSDLDSCSKEASVFESFLSHSRNKADIWSKDDTLVTSNLNKNRKVSSKDQQNRTNKDISSCSKGLRESAPDKQLKYLLFHFRRNPTKSYEEIITEIQKISPFTCDMIFFEETRGPEGVFIAFSMPEDDAIKFIVEMERQRWKKLCGLDIDQIIFGLITFYLQHSKDMICLEYSNCIPIKTKLISTPNSPLFHISCLTSERLILSGTDGLFEFVETAQKLKKLENEVTLCGSHTITEEGDLLFTKGIDIYMLTLSGEIKKFCTEHHPLGCLHSSRANGDILVGSLKTITRYNKQGKKLQTMIPVNKVQNILGRVHYITENINGDIVASDHEKKAVFCVNKLGNYRFEYLGHRNKSEFIPRGICTDARGQILICNASNYDPSVHLLDQDGQYLMHLLTPDQHGLKVPIALCLDNHENLFVGDGKQILVFTYLNMLI